MQPIPRTRDPAIPKATPRTRQKRLRSRRKSKPLAVAITGGIGAGKSEALAAFARHGAATISSDEVVHELYDDPEVQSALTERFGTSDRRAVSEQAVGDRDALIWLEGLLHPRVIERTEAWRDDLSSLPDPPDLAVNEVPLLYEAGAERPLRRRRRDHGATRAASRSRGQPARRARAAPDPRRGEGKPRRLRLRQRRVARGARRVRGRRRS